MGKILGQLKKVRDEGNISDEEISIVLASHDTEILLATKKEKAIKEVISPSHIKKVTKKLGNAEKLEKKVSSQAEKIAKHTVNFLAALLLALILFVAFVLLKNGFLNPFIITLLAFFIASLIVIFTRQSADKFHIKSLETITNKLSKKIKKYLELID